MFRDIVSTNYKNVQVEDNRVPPVVELFDVVNYIHGQIVNSRPVLVHCNGGSGSTGTVVTSYLMNRESLSEEEAAPKVKELRGRT